MLSYIKRRIKGVLAWVIVVLIVIPFALFGIGEYLNTPSDIVVAEVEGDEILKSEFLRLFDARKRDLQARIGDQYNDAIDKSLKDVVINTLIRDRIMLNYAKQLSLTTTDAELKSYIAALNAFQKDGDFSVDRYRQVLRLSGISESRFETLERRNLTGKQFNSDLAHSNFIAPARADSILALLKEQRETSYLKLNFKDYFTKISISDKEIEKFYRENKDTLIEPRKAKVSYLVLSLNVLKEQIKISQEKLAELYEQAESVEYVSEEERRAKHILLKDKEIAEELLTRLKHGASFDELAKEYSKDSASKNKGGDLGFFAKGVMLPEFEKVVFALNKGEVSPLVETRFGYHIIKLIDIKEGLIKSLEEVKEELVQNYKDAKALEELYAVSELLADAVYENKALEALAEQFGLKIMTTDFFSEADVGKEPILSQKFVQTAFSKNIYELGENSNMLELKPTEFTVMRLIDKRRQLAQTLSESKAKIILRLKEKLARKAVLTQMTMIKKALDDGEAKEAQDLVKKNHLSWTKVDWINRETKPLKLSNFVFSLTKPEKQKPTLALNTTSDSVTLVNFSDVRINPDNSKNDEYLQLLKSAESKTLNSSILRLLINQQSYEIFRDRL